MPVCGRIRTGAHKLQQRKEMSDFYEIFTELSAGGHAGNIASEL